MLAPNQCVQDLQAARNLIADLDHWTCGQLHDGFSLETAKRFCAVGAIEFVTVNNNGSDPGPPFYFLTRAAAELYGTSAPLVNDRLGHAAVLRVYEHAIQLASAGEEG